MFWKNRKKRSARPKQVEQVCGNCKLYDPQRGVCRIVVLHEGSRVNVPVDPADKCFFDQTYFDPVSQEETSLLDQVKEVKFWVEDEKGKKTGGDGTVKVEYPEGFFGDKTLGDIV